MLSFFNTTSLSAAVYSLSATPSTNFTVNGPFLAIEFVTDPFLSSSWTMNVETVFWSSWSNWTKCAQPCRYANNNIQNITVHRWRNRTCSHPVTSCVGTASETRPCYGVCNLLDPLKNQYEVSVSAASAGQTNQFFWLLDLTSQTTVSAILFQFSGYVKVKV